ncbi:MAG: ATPase [Salinivirgaceae bacterium]|nr:ATPase [Salinivirgaceae bacterium]
MLLIADSGSTKTTWSILNKNLEDTIFIETSGINPFYQNTTEIYKVLEQEFNSDTKEIDAIWFYGAGCANNSTKKTVGDALKQFFSAKEIHIESDLMAAARALCGDKEGIACILGTGSNSCHYDGINILANVPPLGFILGDEGSGAVIGKQFLADILKNQMPKELTQKFFTTFKTDTAEILNHIYKQPFPNRYAAGFTRFIAENISHPELHKLVKSSFDRFLERNVLQYPKASSLPIHFTGSIACVFKPILEESLTKHQLTCGRILKAPMKGLIEFHSHKI